jgi:hypothetical protein
LVTVLLLHLVHDHAPPEVTSDQVPQQAILAGDLRNDDGHLDGPSRFFCGSRWSPSVKRRERAFLMFKMPSNLDSKISEIR